MSDLRSFPIGVRRIVVSIAVGLLIGTLAVPARAGGPPPTGTITCSVVAPGPPDWDAGIFFRPFINADPRDVRVRVTNSASGCDASGVTGGKAPITNVEVNFSGLLRDGACDSFLSAAPPFEKGKVKIRWRGLNPAGHTMTVAVTKASLASASYDLGSHSLTLIMQPVVKGAFAGASATLHLGLDYFSAFEDMCPQMHDGQGFTLEPFGASNPSTLDVQ